MIEKMSTIGDLWIPAELANDRAVSWGAKSLYSVLRNLIVSNKEIDYCFPSNAWLSNIFAVATRTITEWLGELEAARYITRRAELYEGSYQRRIRLAIQVKKAGETKPEFFFETGGEKIPTPLAENLNPPIDEKLQHNDNKDFFNINNLMTMTEIETRARENNVKEIELSTKAWYFEWLRKCKIFETRESYADYFGEEYITIFDEYLSTLLSVERKFDRVAVQLLDNKKFCKIFAAIIETIRCPTDEYGNDRTIRNRKAYILKSVRDNHKEIDAHKPNLTSQA